MAVERLAAVGSMECRRRMLELDILPSSMVELGASKPAEQGWWQRNWGCSRMGKYGGWRRQCSTGLDRLCKESLWKGSSWDCSRKSRSGKVTGRSLERLRWARLAHDDGQETHFGQGCDGS